MPANIFVIFCRHFKYEGVYLLICIRIQINISVTIDY